MRVTLGLKGADIYPNTPNANFPIFWLPMGIWLQISTFYWCREFFFFWFASSYKKKSSEILWENALQNQCLNNSGSCLDHMASAYWTWLVFLSGGLFMDQACCLDTAFPVGCMAGLLAGQSFSCWLYCWLVWLDMTRPVGCMAGLLAGHDWASWLVLDWQNQCIHVGWVGGPSIMLRLVRPLGLPHFILDTWQTTTS